MELTSVSVLKSDAVAKKVVKSTLIIILAVR